MNNYINKWIEVFKVAPYGETIIFIWLLTELIPSTNHIILWILSLIWWIETYNSFKVKKRLEEILENHKWKDNKKILEKYKKYFCYRQAAISALKNKWTEEYLEKFYEILEENKKNPEDILMWRYLK